MPHPTLPSTKAMALSAPFWNPRLELLRHCPWGVPQQSEHQPKAYEAIAMSERPLGGRGGHHRRQHCLPIKSDLFPKDLCSVLELRPPSRGGLRGLREAASFYKSPSAPPLTLCGSSGC